MKESLKIEITRNIGNLDAPGLITILEHLGVEDDLQVHDKYISIPSALVKDLSGFQKELHNLSKCQRVFAISVDDNRIKIDTVTTHHLHNESKRESLFLLPKSKRKDNLPTHKGTINGIWLTQSQGTLHPAILPNLSSWVTDASASGFQVVLWTNKHELQEKEVAKLEKQGIIVKDCSLCQTSRYYTYFSFFLEKGIQGDKTAFALASDILRMAILELTPMTDYFIYADPNDVILCELGDYLPRLDALISVNSFGFFFNVKLITAAQGKAADFRNDVLIALKQHNPKFFEHYLGAYQIKLEINYRDYTKPDTDRKAQKLALQITMQIENLFKFLPSGVACTTFGPYKDPYKEMISNIHVKNFLNHERDLSNGNTWLPLGKCIEEKMLLTELGLLSEPKREDCSDKEFAALDDPSISSNKSAASQTKAEYAENTSQAGKVTKLFLGAETIDNTIPIPQHKLLAGQIRFYDVARTKKELLELTTESTATVEI